MHINNSLTSALCILAISVPYPAWATDGVHPDSTSVHMSQRQPFEQDFIVTAYYSPVPKQCGYVMGDLNSDIVLNGEGIRGADTTRVYPGMVAAPSTYPFGTRLVLPGIGTVTVHDRGGAIKELGDAHRLDIWVGTGEEGLARALKFGVRHIHAVVYPPKSAQPEESLDLLSLKAPPKVLTPYLTDNATIYDCEAMLTFGKTLNKKTIGYAATHRHFAFLPHIAVPAERMFSYVDPGA